MMKKITLLLTFLVISFGYSQTLPLDFEESDDSNIFASVSDGGTFNIIADADNSGEFVGEFSGKVGGALYDHINVPLTTSLDIAATNTISFRVKQTSTEGTTSHLFKLQPGTGGTGSPKEVAFTTELNVWKDIILTYSGTGTYNELIIFFDFASESVSGTYLIDDIVASSGETENPSENSVTVATSQAWKGFMNVFNLDDSYAFGFAYGAADLRATATTTSMTLEPNIAIWTAEATNEAWFDQSAASQTANKYIEASSFIEDNTLAGSDLTFSGNVSVADLGEGYTVVAFVKALDPNSFATVVNNNADISSTGDFTASATAAELAAGYIIQYGFTVTGPLADPTDTTLGSVVIGEEAPAPDSDYCEKVVAHLGIASGQEASEIKLTVVNSGEKSMKVTIESNNDDAVDLMLIPGDVTGSPTQSAVDSSIAGKMSITLTWPETAPTDVVFNLLWSKVSTGGNWQLGDAPTTFKFAATCATASISDNALLKISMYPNPASSKLNISAPNTIKSAAIYNILGKQVMRLNINKNNESIDVSNLSSGMYLIKYTIGNAVGTAKFIKQ
jgi:hypothetical protein